MLVLLKANSPEKFVVPQAVPRSEMLVASGRSPSAGRSKAISQSLDRRPQCFESHLGQSDSDRMPRSRRTITASAGGYPGRSGVLVPLSPQAQDELAGAEWYDSGIGFAVPLAEILPYLER